MSKKPTAILYLDIGKINIYTALKNDWTDLKNLHLKSVHNLKSISTQFYK